MIKTKIIRADTELNNLRRSIANKNNVTMLKADKIIIEIVKKEKVNKY